MVFVRVCVCPSLMNVFLYVCMGGRTDGYFLPVNAVKAVWKGVGCRGGPGQGGGGNRVRGGGCSRGGGGDRAGE